MNEELKPTDDQCDLLVSKVLDKIAAKYSDQYGPMLAEDCGTDIVHHHTLRRGLVRAAYMLGEMEWRERCAVIAAGARALPNASDSFAGGWCSASIQIEQAIRMSGGYNG